MTNLRMPLDLVATWTARNYTCKLFRYPRYIGEYAEYNLVAIDSGNVRREDINLLKRPGLEEGLPIDLAWIAEDAPANARRILKRFM